MQPATRDALAARLARYDRLVEVGVGDRPDVAGALAAAGKQVTATDIRPVDVPAGVRFVRDDVVDAAARGDPGPAYRADAVYAINLPPELHAPTRAVARATDAAFCFTTLGGDPPTVPVRSETLAVDGDGDGDGNGDGTGGRVTLHVARPVGP